MSEESLHTRISSIWIGCSAYFTPLHLFPLKNFWDWFSSLIIFLGSQSRPTASDKFLARRTLPRSWDRVQQHSSRGFSFFFLFSRFSHVFNYSESLQLIFKPTWTPEPRSWKKLCSIRQRALPLQLSQRLCVPSSEVGPQNSCCFSPNQASIYSFRFWLSIQICALFFSGATSFEFCFAASSFLGEAVSTAQQVL